MEKGLTIHLCMMYPKYDPKIWNANSFMNLNVLSFYITMVITFAYDIHVDHLKDHWKGPIEEYNGEKVLQHEFFYGVPWKWQKKMRCQLFFEPQHGKFVRQFCIWSLFDSLYKPLERSRWGPNYWKGPTPFL